MAPSGTANRIRNRAHGRRRAWRSWAIGPPVDGGALDSGSLPMATTSPAAMTAVIPNVTLQVRKWANNPALRLPTAVPMATAASRSAMTAWRALNGIMSPTYTSAVGTMAHTEAPAMIRAAISRSRLGARAERAQAAAVAARLIRMMRMRPARSEAKPQKGCANPYARYYAVAAMATVPTRPSNSTPI